jgi:hypothetical protein
MAVIVRNTKERTKIAYYLIFPQFVKPQKCEAVDGDRAIVFELTVATI